MSVSNENATLCMMCNQSSWYRRCLRYWCEMQAMWCYGYEVVIIWWRGTYPNMPIKRLNYMPDLSNTITAGQWCLCRIWELIRPVSLRSQSGMMSYLVPSTCLCSLACYDNSNSLFVYFGVLLSILHYYVALY